MSDGSSNSGDEVNEALKQLIEKSGKLPEQIAKEIEETQQARPASERVHHEDESPTPGIAVILGIIGGLSILGGVILAVQSWPGDAGYGYSWNAVAYTLSLTWLFSGLISGVVFFAFAAITSYLYRMSEDTKALVIEVRGKSGPIKRGDNSATTATGQTQISAETAVRNSLCSVLRRSEAKEAGHWKALEHNFPEDPPAEPIPLSIPAQPAMPDPETVPNPKSEKYQAQATVGDIFSRRRWKEKTAAAKQLLNEDRARWRRSLQEVEERPEKVMEWERKGASIAEKNTSQLEAYSKELNAWEGRKRKFDNQQSQELQRLEEAYKRGEQEGVLELCQAVLQNSTYPAELEIEHTVSVDIDKCYEIKLCIPNAITLREEPSAEGDKKQSSSLTYREFAGQVLLKTASELFQADHGKHINTLRILIATRWMNPSIGREEERILVEAQIGRDQYSKLDLQRVSSKECLKWLGARESFEM